MTRERNLNAGVPTAESTGDDPTPHPAARQPDAHYEADPDQLVKVVHLKRPAELAPHGPTRQGEHESPADPGVTDVAVSTTEGSVWEAGPPEDEA